MNSLNINRTNITLKIEGGVKMYKNNKFFKGVSVIVSVLFLINNISYGAPNIAQHMQKESTLKEMASALDGRTPAAIKDGLVIIKDGIRIEPRRRVVLTASGELKSSSAGISSLGVPAIGRLVDPGRFIEEGIKGIVVEKHRARPNPTIPLEKTLAFLEEAGGITAEACLRGADLGSSMDLGRGAGRKAGLKELVTPRGAKELADIAQTIVIPSKFRAKMRITTLTDKEKEKYGEGSIVYISELHDCPAEKPGIYKEPIMLVDGKAPNKQADMVGYILWNLFGIHSVKVEFDVYYPGKEGDKSYGIIATKAGGMGTSGATNTLLYELGNMLRDAGLTSSECASEAIDDENTVAQGYTGGQEGYVATAAEIEDNARAVDLVWIGGIKDVNGNPLYHPHSAFAVPMLKTEDDVKFVEEHAVYLQIGARFEWNPEKKKFEKTAHRSASSINTGWMHSAETIRDSKGNDVPVDPVGADFHRAKVGFVKDMRQGLLTHDVTLINKGNMGHVDVRNELSLREAQIIVYGDLTLGIPPQTQRLNDYSISDKIGLATYSLSDAEKDIVEAQTLSLLDKEKARKTITEQEMKMLDDYVITNLINLHASNISLYSDYSKKLYQAIEEEMAENPGLSMSAFNTGAGGDGGIIMLWSSGGVKHIEDFLLRRLGIERFDAKEVVEITTKTGGTLAGWMPFEVGEIGTRIRLDKMTLEDAASYGFFEPEASPTMEYNEATGAYAKSSSAGTFAMKIGNFTLQLCKTLPDNIARHVTTEDARDFLSRLLTRLEGISKDALSQKSIGSVLDSFYDAEQQRILIGLFEPPVEKIPGSDAYLVLAKAMVGQYLMRGIPILVRPAKVGKGAEAYFVSLPLELEAYGAFLKALPENWPETREWQDYVEGLRVLVIAMSRRSSLKSSSAGTFTGLLFDTGHKIAAREGVEFTQVAETPRTAAEVRELLGKAKKPLVIKAYLRGMDLCGSSLDLPEFQYSLTDEGVMEIEDIPSTPTLASEFSVTIRFEAADDPGIIEYIAPDYGITEDNPYIVKGKVELKDGRVPDGQKGAPAYIFANLFGLSGVRIICESISPMAMAGGMESSNAFNVALYAAASMLSGRNWTLADIFADSVRLENKELAGLTGGQGHLSSILGGAYHHIWQSGIVDAEGKRINPYSAFSVPFINPEDFPVIQKYMALAQAGKEYRDGKAVESRASTLVNFMWTDLLRERDEIGVKLHREKLGLTARYINAVRNKERNKGMKTAVECIDRYVDIRDTLCKRWAESVLKEEKIAWLHRLEPGDREVVAIYGLDEVEKQAVLAEIKSGKTYNIEKLNQYALKNLRVLYDNEISLYSDTAKDLIQAARAEGIAVMPLGAGGPGAILGVVSSKGGKHLEKFFESQNFPLLTDDSVREVIRGTGLRLLKGYMPFKIGREPIQFEGFKELGLQEPALPVSAVYDEQTAKFATPKAASAGQLDLANLASLTPEALGNAIVKAKTEDVKRILIQSKLAAEVSKLDVSGTIVFNDEPLSAEQQQILKSILGKNTPSLQELENLMNCTIRLKSELTPNDIKGELIIVSDTKLESFPDAKYLMFEQKVKLDNIYLPVVPMIAMAKGLLALKDMNQIELINSIKELSRSLCKKPLQDEIIETYIQNGIFNLELPKPEAYDYKKLEYMQRQAMAALIAA